MIVPILRSCIVMLEEGNKDKVFCARALLVELVKELEKEPTVVYKSKRTVAGMEAGPYDDSDLDPEAIAAKEELI